MISGFVVIDKPAGITSHDVVSRVRRIFGTRKVGHTGTLDPFATGVLPVAVNDGTKVIPFLDEGRKVYEATLRFGVTTDTLDMTGTIRSERDPSAVTKDLLLSSLARFTGLIRQIPPMYSAIKQNGQPLYKLARQGVEVERKARDVEIHFLELLSLDLPYATVRVGCSRGTYVRTLADDIGCRMGCGAALQELRRVCSGPFQIESAHSFEYLENAAKENSLEKVCLSPSAALSHLPDIELSDAGLAKVAFGRSPGLDEMEVAAFMSCSNESQLVRLSHNGALAAVALATFTGAVACSIALKRVFV